MIYNFYVFNRKGKCMYYYEWNRPQNTLSSEDPDEDRKLMFGMLFSLKQLCQKLSPSEAVAGLQSFRTDRYTLHHFEAASGIKLILNTSHDVVDLSRELREIYSSIFVEFVVKNPLHTQQMLQDGSPITCELFARNLQQFIESLPCAST